MTKTEYRGVGETLYTEILPNGLPVCVIPKPDYRKTFAVFATDYGGADRRFTLAGARAEPLAKPQTRRAGPQVRRIDQVEAIMRMRKRPARESGASWLSSISRRCGGTR